MIYRQAAAEKARQQGLAPRYILQHGKKADCNAYVTTGVWPSVWGDKKPYQQHRPKPVQAKAVVNTCLPANASQAEPVNTPLSAITPGKEPVNTSLLRKAKNRSKKSMTPDGRIRQGVPKFENWFCRIYPRDISYPAWKALTKTATDVAHICRAKSEHARASGAKDVDGRPLFDFCFSEAVKTFGISRPTFDKSMQQLITLGFIERVKHGGILDGKGVKAKYRTSDRWRSLTVGDITKEPVKDLTKLQALLGRKTKPQ